METKNKAATEPRNRTAKRKVEHKEFGVSLGYFPAYVCIMCGEVYFDEQTATEIQLKSKQLGLFGLARKAKVAEIGNSLAIRIPKEIAEFMDLKKGEEVIVLPDGKKQIRISS